MPFDEQPNDEAQELAILDSRSAVTVDMRMKQVLNSDG